MKSKGQTWGEAAVHALYVHYRFSYGIRESVQRVAAYTKLSAVEVCKQLGLEERFANRSPLLPRSR